MKKKVWFPLLFALIALTYCGKEYLFDSTKETSEVVFNFSASVPSATNQTKAVNITRYVMEVYKTSDPTTIVKRVEQASGTIVTSLEANTNYICLFWADGVTPNDNTGGTFNAIDLKNVTLNAGKNMTDAFFARLNITDATRTFNVTLKRATAKVNMIATDVVTANKDLVVTFNQYNSFNTLASEVTGTAVATSKTFNSSATTGTLGTFLTFASVSGILTDFAAVYNSTVAHEKKNVPLKANYITNIRGSYSLSLQDFTITIQIDDRWENVVEGVDVNVGTVANPKWIQVADRNALKGGVYGATAGKTATDYGYYYQWSDATTDAMNADKAYRACFDFGGGSGLWRLPTKAELTAISGNNGASNTVDANRKLKWAGGPAWKLYSERAGKTAEYVYLPMGGLINNNYGSTATSNVAITGYYWSSTPNGALVASLGVSANGSSIVTENYKTGGFSVRCVKDM